jgi:hypothetical protein
MPRILPHLPLLPASGWAKVAAEIHRHVQIQDVVALLALALVGYGKTTAATKAAAARKSESADEAAIRKQQSRRRADDGACTEDGGEGGAFAGGNGAVGALARVALGAYGVDMACLAARVAIRQQQQQQDGPGAEPSVLFSMLLSVPWDRIPTLYSRASFSLWGVRQLWKRRRRRRRRRRTLGSSRPLRKAGRSTENGAADDDDDIGDAQRRRIRCERLLDRCVQLLSLALPLLLATEWWALSSAPTSDEAAAAPASPAFLRGLPRAAATLGSVLMGAIAFLLSVSSSSSLASSSGRGRAKDARAGG